MQLFKRVLPSALTEFSRHIEQEAEPIAFLYVDAAHTKHCPPSEPVYPASHLQLVKRVLASRLTEFSGHGEQLVEPILVLYVEAAHA